MSFQTKRNIHDEEISLNDIIKYIESNKEFINGSRSDDSHIKVSKNTSLTQNKNPSPTQSKKTGLIFGKNLSLIFGTQSINTKNVLKNVECPANTNISFASSVLYSLTGNDKQEIIEAFIKKLNRDSKTNYEKYEYEKYGWKHKTLNTNVKSFIMGKDIMRYVADVLYINIFILDIESDSITYVGSDVYCKYKKNIFLNKNKESFEPVKFDDLSFLDYKHPIIQKILNSSYLIEKLDCDFTHDKEDLTFITVPPTHDDKPTVSSTHDSKTKEKDKESKTSKDSKTKDSKTSKESKPKESKSKDKKKATTKNTLEELQEMAGKMGISLKYDKNGKKTNKTKAMLISDINGEVSDIQE